MKTKRPISKIYFNIYVYLYYTDSKFLHELILETNTCRLIGNFKRVKISIGMTVLYQEKDNARCFELGNNWRLVIKKSYLKVKFWIVCQATQRYREH